MKRLIFLAPISLFLLLAIYFMLGLGKDPSRLPSALLDRPAPAFALPPIEGRAQGLASADLSGDVVLLNVFASWCAGCRIEHPLLMEIAREGGVRLYGLNWKDKPGDGARWLARYGDPYARIGDDASGRVALDFGVAGAPETFVIDREGRVRYKHVGPITPEVWRDVLTPLIEELRNAPQGGDAVAAAVRLDG